MAHFAIFNGPSERHLFEALRKRRDGLTVYFRVRKGFSSGKLRMDCYVEQIEVELDLDHSWRITVKPLGEFGVLSGLYCPRTRVGSLSSEDLMTTSASA